MFDELATEKRIRWDPKTNRFLGICREHVYRTSTEFVNEDDMEELFQNLDDGKVHYAGEVRVPSTEANPFLGCAFDLFLGNSRCPGRSLEG